MKYGFFDDSNREYVITTPQTPYPWINYLGSQEYFSLISNTAGGYSFYKDARLRRITRYRYNNVPLDLGGGKYYYINDGGEVWSPGWAPVKKDLDKYECRHGMGYTKISGELNGVKTDITYFVPLNTNAEVHKVTISNVSDNDKNIKLFSFAEWCLWNALDDMTNFQRNYNTGEVEVKDSVIYHKTEYKERRNHYAFFSVNSPIYGFDSDRESFMGTYNGFHNPDAVLKGEPNNSVADGWHPIASHCVEVNLKPGESKELVFVLGYVENDVDDKWESKNVINKSKAEEIINRFSTTEAVDTALGELADSWDELLSKYIIDSDDDKLNRMVNIWNQYQCMVTFNLSRSASYFESGIGRGMGFRDSNQDILGFVHQIPDRARERIIDLASTQLEDGGAYHQYQPLTKKGNDEIGGNFNDDPLWLILAATSYIKETGDYSILDVMTPFDNDETTSTPFSDHLKRAFDHVLNNLGPHGLPLIGRADWNDCLNLNCFSSEPGESFQTTTSKDGRVAESVMIAGMFCYIGDEYARLMAKVNNNSEAERAYAEVNKMRKIVMEHGWDGEWFVRAYDDFGKKIGSKENEEGKIFIESQGLCIMGQCGIDDGSAIKALDAVDERLGTEYGLVLLNPGFTKYYIEYGEISTYPAGYKENAGIFCHNNAWIMAAEATVGRGNKAFDYYTRIAPAYTEERSEVHRLEPYVYSQMIAGKDASRFGEAKNSWLTGTASWNFVAISQYILGIKPEYDGLKIEPCIPKEWNEYTITRQYRNDTYKINIKNPDHVSTGVKKILVDNKEIEGNILPLFGDGKVHEVEVILG